MVSASAVTPAILNQPLVSVVIPTYNHGHYVGQAVDSALNQSYQNIEVLVIDDGSTDDTRQRMVQYGDRIRYIHQPNQGLSAARNTGIANALGDYLAFLDSDDSFHPRKIEAQLACLAAHPEIDLLGTTMFSDETIVWCPIELSCLPMLAISLEMMAIRPRFAPSSVIAHKKCFQAVGWFDTELRSVEDRDMWLRIATQFKMGRLEIPLTWYRVSPNSMSTHPERMEHFELLVLNRSLDFPELKPQVTVHRLALSHCYRSSAYTFYTHGRYREALSRLMQSVKYWPGFYAKEDEVLRLYRCRLVWACIKSMIKGKRAVPRSAVDATSANMSLSNAPTTTGF